jgi:hypothetical protein
MQRRDTNRTRCSLALDFERIVEESVFKRLTPDTTPEQYQQAIASLIPLFQRFEHQARSNPFHYGSIVTGMRHHCVGDSFAAADYYLKAGLLLKPVPKPAPEPPAPREQGMPAEDVVSNLETLADSLRRLPTETFFGEEEEG